MPTPPDSTAVTAYLAEIGMSASYTPAQIADALAAETATQARRCRLEPVDVVGEDPQPYVADLAQALCRRVAHNLALRPLPLGVVANISDANVATNRVGGLDAEVRRLEAPFRKIDVG